ncbi:hypothetical protein HMPREF0591_0680 [Mycobacterium parascrofulaceum ATCC BAA-614]|uniref:Uncharacterized protein n=1 Tax=Mycobacterium parascrofulaceum ATCC BAA-614 TaxID=525368 RepID=D5P3D6_9MYCO|nr:hypothetical protein HMPREF0591_0680 [Mycobacterium parascrofulaceum ATCC BAA-614]
MSCRHNRRGPFPVTGRCDDVVPATGHASHPAEWPDPGGPGPARDPGLGIRF